MAEMNKKTSIKSVLYEKSPKENLETLKIWAGKYKPTLKWIVPMAAVYGAYRILNSKEFDLSVNNLAEVCEKRIGFKLEILENKKALKELMAIGGIAAGAYGAVKAVSGILGTKEKAEDISVEEVEAGMTQLDSISKKFAWIQPKTEDMLPVALSVILVYVTLHEPKFNGKISSKIHFFTEDLQIRLGTYADMAKLFIQDKFDINLNTAEGKNKIKICGFLVAVLGVLAFLYGKKVLGNKEASKESEEETSNPVKSFVEQAKAIIRKIAPTAYTTVLTMLVSKKILASEEILEFYEEDDTSDSETHEEENVAELESIDSNEEENKENLIV